MLVDTIILALKSALALMLLVAGAAKLADLPSFSATVRLFMPRKTPRGAQLGVASAVGAVELALGSASLSFPATHAINLVVLLAGCVFVVISAVGYIFHRDVACRCFGRLSHRTFDAAALARSVMIAALAAVVVASNVSPAATRITTTSDLFLFAAEALVAIATFTAARALAATTRL